ncbi:hypothetical protein GCM10028806_09540 [Spirosoma terrae]
MFEGSSEPTFFTSELERNRVLAALFDREQIRTLPELAQMLICKGYSSHQINDLLERLIDDQLLVSELAINVTGQDYLSRIVGLVRLIPGQDDLCQTLSELQNILSDHCSLSEKQASIHAVFLKRIGVPLGNFPLLRADTIFSENFIQLSSKQLGYLQQTLEKLFGLSAQYADLDPLAGFRHTFYQRYDDQEIPLMVALDIDIDFSFTGNGETGEEDLIGQIAFSDGPVDTVDEARRHLPDMDKWLRKIYNRWFESRKEVLILTDQDLRDLPASDGILPNSYFTLGYFLAPSAKAIDEGEFRFRAKVISGPTAFPLLGRFAQVDKELEKLIKKTLDQQEASDPSRIYAEIVHLPDAITGNVIQRPILSSYEIPYLGYSTLPAEQQITVDDLLVSVPQGKRVILRSKRLGKEVVPRLTTAHTYQAGLPVYRFLGEVQRQEANLSVSWHWGRLNDVRYLPRVQYRNIILHEARWRLEWHDYQSTLSELENVRQWRQLWQWPRYIALVQADQELLIDLDSQLCMSLLVNTVKRLQTVFLIEWLRVPEQCFIEDRSGKFTHEVILPFFQKKPLYKADNSRPLPAKLKKQNMRNFPPGSEWLYLKVYCGHRTATKVITKLGKIARTMVRSGLISHWFFIRYQDPEPHIRIRFHLTSASSFLSVVDANRKQLTTLLDSGEIYTIQLDTYKREIERYGLALIDLVEWCFWADSDAVLTLLLEKISIRERFFISLYSIDSCLSFIGYSTDEKKNFCQNYFQALFHEHGNNHITRKKLAGKYRENEKTVVSILTGKAGDTISKQQIQNIERRNKRIISFLHCSDRNVENLGSIIHLFINRLFEHHQRTYELLLYHHLTRAYQSISANFAATAHFNSSEAC